MTKKKKERRRRRKKEDEKIEIFIFGFSNLIEVSGNVRVDLASAYTCNKGISL